MICDNTSKTKTVGQTDLSIRLLIDDLLLFLDKYLPLFPVSLEKSSLIANEESEKLINQKLIDLFNGYSHEYNPYLQYRFIFRKDDESKGTNYKPDIGVTIWNSQKFITVDQSFFQLECKRLPTPNPSKKRSENEYVKGAEENTGGIERFKNSEHGQHLSEAALIGYVQKETLSFWVKQIEKWIKAEIKSDNKVWTESDRLKNMYQTDVLHKYYSDCKRKNKEEIKLYHFLVDITKVS